MRLLLDTHAILWWLAGDDVQLGPYARGLLDDRDNEVLVSLVSFWELSVKKRAGKLEIDVRKAFQQTQVQGFKVLRPSPSDLIVLEDLPKVEGHRDPFDHLLIAQAISNYVIFMSQDGYVPHYSVDYVRCSGGDVQYRQGRVTDD